MKVTGKITVKEALAQGFEHFYEDGSERALDLKDYPDGPPKPPDQQVFWLIAKEPIHYNLSAEEIKDAIMELPENQDQFADEDGDLCEIVDTLFVSHKYLFQQLSDALNEKFNKRGFLNPTSIQVV